MQNDGRSIFDLEEYVHITDELKHENAAHDIAASEENLVK
jgi:hypothetical protein